MALTGSDAPAAITPGRSKQSDVASRLGHAKAQRVWSADQLRALNRDLGLNIDRFIESDNVKLVADPQTHLQYFIGCHSGDAVYCEELSALPFYYMDEKWEFSVAEQLICENPGPTLEIGSGPGHFLNRLKSSGVEHLGLEFNKAAIDLCVAKGVNVANQPLIDVVRSGRRFKFVCSFQVLEHVEDPVQVLEHVEDPVELIREMLSVIEPGGALVISVLDRDSFIRRFTDPVLDMPPHHMTRWSEDAFRRIALSLNAKVVDVQREPLAAHHVGWYVESYFDWVPRAFKLRALAVRMMSPFIHAVRRMRNLPGHTLLVVIRRDLDA